MKITRATEYAIRCVLYLASRYGEIVSRQEVSYAMEIPDHFLAKIAQQLAKAGLIEIRQGRYGGYRLKQPPEETSLLDVMEAIAGEAFPLNECVIKPESCRQSPVCPVHRLWVKARHSLIDLFANAKLSDLASESSNFCFRKLFSPKSKLDGSPKPEEKLQNSVNKRIRGFK